MTKKVVHEKKTLSNEKPKNKSDINKLIFALFECKDPFRMKDLNKNDRERELSNTLGRVMENVGVVKDPSDDLAEKIIAYLPEYYGILYPQEVELAFDLAMAGHISAPLEHFQSFNLMYVTKVLNAYIKYRGEIAMKGISEKRKEQKQIPPKQNYEEEAKAKILEIFNLFKEKGQFTFPHYFNLFAFNWLDEKKLIPLSKEEKLELLNQAKAYLQGRAESEGNARRMREMLNSVSKDAKYYAKQLALKKYFEDLIEYDQNLEKIIETYEQKQGSPNNTV